MLTVVSLTVIVIVAGRVCELYRLAGQTLTVTAPPYAHLGHGLAQVGLADPGGT